jgi:argininosuccinate lyase
MTVTGRIDGIPAQVWHDEVLAPQFDSEVEHLLRHYVAIEKVLLLEYQRMGLVEATDAAAIAERLDTADGERIRADPRENMSDISFALERYVALGPARPFAAWHVDRSRNDFQACAQLMAAREELIAIAGRLLDFARQTADLAARYVDVPMPGYTHAQAAQIISPGFYLSALSAETLSTVQRLSSAYDLVDASPLGAGTMAGQELDWDRQRMAALLGFDQVAPHALVAVASRGWLLELSFGLAAFAVTLSRFVTDLMTWGGSEFGFIDLPDELAGISAAMPQKRNFPVLERIRGRCSHVASCAFAAAQGQRNTAYTNTVEVSKEAGGQLRIQFDTLRSTIRLTTAVVSGLSFRADRMRAACRAEYLGGFSLANRLTLDAGIPWRTAQVIAGRYVKQAVERGLQADHPDPALLKASGREAGFEVGNAAALLAVAFDIDEGLRAKRSDGSAHPDAVMAVLLAQQQQMAEQRERWRQRARTVAQAAEAVDAHFSANRRSQP